MSMGVAEGIRIIVVVTMITEEGEEVVDAEVAGEGDGKVVQTGMIMLEARTQKYPPLHKVNTSDLMKMGRMGVTVKFRKRSKSLPAESASDQLSNG